MKAFESINKGYNSVFKAGKLSVGIVIPIENYAQSPIPTMIDHVKRVQLVEKLGFKSVWIRDIPYNVPTFGDAGQIFDPFTYLGFLAAHTSEIALGISSIALPLHHPLHVAKAAHSIDQLSEGRFMLGVASGDRYDEYPAMGIEYDKRSELFQEAFEYIRKTHEAFPVHSSKYFGRLKGNVDMLPKSTSHKIPMLMTGFSRQTLEWNAQYADGWMDYPRNIHQQKSTIEHWRELVAKSNEYDKPFIQPLYIVLEEHDDFKPQSIQLGFRIGINYLVEYFHHLQSIGVNHIAINLRFNSLDMEQTLAHLGNKLLPHFHIDQREQINL